MLCPVTTVTNKSNPHGLIIIKKKGKKVMILYLILKKLPWRHSTKLTIPTTKNGKFVITFSVFGTP